MKMLAATTVGILMIFLAAFVAAGCRGRVQPTPPPSPLSTPAAPSNLRAIQLGPTQITVTWQDNSDDEAGFRVYLSGTEEVGRVGQNVTRAVLADLTCNVQYQYHVRAVNAAGESPPSNVIDVMTAACP